MPLGGAARSVVARSSGSSRRSSTTSVPESPRWPGTGPPPLPASKLFLLLSLPHSHSCSYGDGLLAATLDAASDFFDSTCGFKFYFIFGVGNNSQPPPRLRRRALASVKMRSRVIVKRRETWRQTKPLTDFLESTLT